MPLLVFLLCVSLNLVHSSGDAIDFVFNGFAGANLTVDDSAMVTPDGVLVLTNGTYLMKGHGVYAAPLHFRSPSGAGGGVLSFSTTFVFAILSEYAELSAYGIAFFITPYQELLGHVAEPVHGSLQHERCRERHQPCLRRGARHAARRGVRGHGQQPRRD
jgi:hypothetical protein